MEEKELYKILEVLGRFGIWKDDCTFVPFYENDGAVGGAPETVLAGSYRREGEVLAVFGNLTGEKVRFRLSLDSIRLKLDGKAAPVDAETGVELKDGTVEIAPYDVKMLLIRKS